MNEGEHISSAFDRDLDAIQALVMKMGGLVEDSIRQGFRSLQEGDDQLSHTVRTGDKAIDELDDLINERCARVIALRAPTAVDLRLVLAIMRISANLERIGDYSKNMAKRSMALKNLPSVDDALPPLGRMVKAVKRLLTDALDSYAQRDADLARAVIQRDFEIDQMYASVFREYLTFMLEDPRSIGAVMHLHFIAKNIERMGDHVTDIAEQVIYFVTGEHVDEDRPKGDNISMTLD